MSDVAILDLGYGNTRSVALAFARLGAGAVLVSDAAGVAAARRLVLPGVGAAGYAMARLEEAGLTGVLRERQGPMLGICLGMQLMFEEGEEDDKTALLGLVPGRVRLLEKGPGRPVPHMGWTQLSSVVPDIGLSDGDYVYFAHSYAADAGPDTAARADYGRPFSAAIRKGALWGAQFHPERSADAGARFLRAFLSS